MAYTNPAHHPAGYNYPSQPQLFPVEENGWGGQGWVAPSVCVAHFLFIRACTLTDLQDHTLSTELANPSTGHGLYAEGDSYIHTGLYAVQPTSENRVPQTIPHPDPMSFLPPPPLAPTTPSSSSQSVIPNLLPPQTNLPDYLWVPQRQYTLTAHHFTPANPILFSVDSGEPGIRLSTAINRRFSHLRDRDDLVFESSRSPTITMRLEVCDLPRLARTLTDGA